MGTHCRFEVIVPYIRRGAFIHTSSLHSTRPEVPISFKIIGLSQSTYSPALLSSFKNEPYVIGVCNRSSTDESTVKYTDLLYGDSFRDSENCSSCLFTLGKGCTKIYNPFVQCVFVLNYFQTVRRILLSENSFANLTFFATTET